MPGRRKQTDEQAHANLALSWELVISAARSFTQGPDSQTLKALRTAIEGYDQLVAGMVDELLDEDAT